MQYKMGVFIKRSRVFITPAMKQFYLKEPDFYKYIKNKKPRICRSEALAMLI